MNDKYTADSLPRFCLNRPRLNELFDKVSDKRILFVSAPAGYGKTISTRMWLNQTGRETIWIGLDGYDNTPSIFYKLFCTGILSIQPDNKAMADILRSPAFSQSPVEHTIRMLNELMPDDRKYAVVLDDIHLITNREILKSGLLVRKRLPFSFVTVVLTRNDIAEDYTYALGEERYAIISADDLAFTGNETREFFHAYGHIITPEEAEEVREATNGWAMGLRALAMSGQMTAGRQAAQILSSYLKWQVWDKWDASLHLFLMQTSVTDDMPVALCERLTGRPDSRDTLEKLNQANAFVTRLSEDVYGYHHLFLEFLRTQAAEHRLDQRALFKTAAEYYIEQGEFFVARHYAIRCGDINLILDVMRHLFQCVGISMDEHIQSSKIYADETPSETMCECAPFLYATPLWEHFLTGNAARMTYYLDKIYDHLPVIAEHYPHFLSIMPFLRILDYRVPLCALSLDEDTELAINLATFTCEMPFIHRSIRDYSELAGDNLLHNATRLFKPIFKEQCELIVSLIASGLHMEANRQDEALSAALHARNLVTENTGDDLRISVYAHIAATYYSLNSAAYNEMLAEAGRYIDQNEAYSHQPNILAIKTRIMLLSGDRNAAHAWLDSYFITTSEPLALYKMYQHFTTARACVVLGLTERATRYIDGLRQMASDFNRPLDIAEAGVLRAILEWAEGHKTAAQTTLTEVLMILQPYGFVRVVSLEGAAVLPILRRLEARVKKEDYSGSLHPHYLRKVTLSAFEQAKRFKGIAANIKTKPVKLSGQQRKVLTLLSKGYTYKEIMEETGLTIHTVKSHAAAAYDRLGAHTAIEAAAKAREMGLI